jgi:hypothetical protein
LASILRFMDIAKRQTRLAGARDVAVRNLRDLTIAIAIIAAAGVGLAAWVSAATIPGNTGPADSSGNASSGAARDSYTADPGNGQGTVSSQPGSAVVVSGGSR